MQMCNNLYDSSSRHKLFKPFNITKDLISIFQTN